MQFPSCLPILVSCYDSLSYYRNRRVARPTLQHYDQRRSVCSSVSRMHTCSLAGTPRMGSTGPWLPTCTPPSWRLHPSSPSRDKQLDSICSPPQPILGSSHRPAADRPPNCSRHSQRSSIYLIIDATTTWLNSRPVVSPSPLSRLSTLETMLLRPQLMMEEDWRQSSAWPTQPV